VPVSNGKPQMLFHRFAFNQFLRIVVFEGERVFRFWTFEPDLGNAREEFFGWFFHGGYRFSRARLRRELEESKGRTRSPKTECRSPKEARIRDRSIILWGAS